MQISRALFNRMVQRFVNASNVLFDVGAGSNMRIQPVNVSFLAGLNVVLADVPVQGSLINTAVEAMPDLPPYEYTDVMTGERVGVWNTLNWPGIFVQSADGPTFTIHGTRLVSFDGLTLLATQPLDAPVPFAKIGDGCKVPPIEFRFPTTMVR